MAEIIATIDECERGLLPPVCVRCGAPATERVPRPLPFLLRLRTLWWVGPAFFLAYLLVPAVAVLFICPPRRVWYGLPTCADHRDHWAWRDRVRRRYLWPPICVASLAVEVACLTGLILHPLLYAHAAAGVIMVGLALDGIAVLRGEVRFGPGRSGTVRLNGVHPAFVAALVEDRARNRVWDAARRPQHSTERDDFDDEPV
jgi:hypothetical protein